LLEQSHIDMAETKLDDFSATFDLSLPHARTALVVGHPGHELMVHGWLEVTQPLVFVFTDGSGRSNQSRLASTTRILNQAGAKCGSIYGRLSDAQSYAAILNHEFDLFVGLARELNEAFASERIDYVAGDAFEGYNPMHDVCRLVINAAVTVARRMRGHHVGNLEFSLTNQPTVYHEPPHVDGICRLLDDAALTQKMAAAQGYAELAGEVHATLERTSIDGLRVECLRPVGPGSGHYFSDQLPFYESYGEKQVAAGHYHRVLRYHEHIAPLAEALSRYAEGTI
jgi:hypothetical protein